MSSQTIYFDNPQSITTLQGQVGNVSGQITTQNISLTGALYNSLGQFVDKYTVDKGMGPYQVDCIPITIRDTFAMPKFSNNLLVQTGGAYSISPSGPYTVQTFDTVAPYDIVVYAPSSRTGAIVTTPVFQQTTAGEVDNLGSFGQTLEDWKGFFGTTTSAEAYSANFGSTTLGNKFWSFYGICSSGALSSTGVRQAALDSITSDPDYNIIKQNLKYPFKVWNQIKGVSDFQFQSLLDLNGNPLVNTGADGVTGYPTTITSTTYTTGPNLLPISSNVNAINGKMGLLIVNVGAGMAPCFDSYAHQVASLGYIVILAPCHPLTPYYARFGGKKTTAQLLADQTILTPDTYVSNTYSNQNSRYGSTNDNTVGTSTNGFWRGNVSNNSSQAPAMLMFERMNYQIKCILNTLGLAQYIDFNNVVQCGLSLGGQSCYTSAIITANNGIATQYTIPVTGKPYLWKLKAMIAWNGQFLDFSLKTDVGASGFNYTNNRFALHPVLTPLQIPLIVITGEGDAGYTPQPIDDRYNSQYQTIFQVTKQQSPNSYDLLLAKCGIFYKPTTRHNDVVASSISTDDGQYSGIFEEGFRCDWKQGWYIPLNPQFPSIESIYESGLINEVAYAQTNDLKVHNIIQMMTHRFLGLEYPVPIQSMESFGLRCDIFPTQCHVYTDHEYMRVGPWGQLTYDSNYNVLLSNVPGATGATQPPISFYATGTNQSIGATTLVANNLKVTSSALPATDTTIAYKIPIVVNGTTYYISLTAAQ